MKEESMKHDRIDKFERDWTKAYPDLDPWPLRIFGRVMRLAGILEEQGVSLREANGVSRGEVQVLTALRRTLPDFTLSPKDLAQHMLVTSAAVTGRLNSLEEKELVTRRIDDQSRRRILVTLTPAGAELIEGYIQAVVANQAIFTRALADHERSETEAALRRLLLAVGDSSSDNEPSPSLFLGLNLL